MPQKRQRVQKVPPLPPCRRVVWVDTHGRCSSAPTGTAWDRYPGAPAQHLPRTMHLQTLQWERPKSPHHAQRSSHPLQPLWQVSRQRICKRGPTLPVLQPQVCERLATPEAGFLKLVAVMSILTKQKVLGHTLSHARWHSDVMQYLISGNLSCQSLQWPQPRCCIPTFLWHRCLHSSA